LSPRSSAFFLTVPLLSHLLAAPPPKYRRSIAQIGHWEPVGNKKITEKSRATGHDYSTERSAITVASFWPSGRFAPSRGIALVGFRGWDLRTHQPETKPQSQPPNKSIGCPGEEGFQTVFTAHWLTFVHAPLGSGGAPRPPVWLILSVGCPHLGNPGSILVSVSSTFEFPDFDCGQDSAVSSTLARREMKSSKSVGNRRARSRSLALTQQISVQLRK